MAEATASTASSWPKTTRLSDSPRVRRRSRSEREAEVSGMRAMRATMSSMSGDADARVALGAWPQAQAGSGLVENVDGAVG